jgi:hypothetical protein
MTCITTPVLTERGQALNLAWYGAGRCYAMNTIRCRVINTVMEEGKRKNYEY